MSSQIPMEYVMFQKKLGMEMSKTLGEAMAAFYIIGSSAGSSVFPGVSDVNFVLVLKDDLENPAETMKNAARVFQNYKDNPMFTTLVNFEIYFESQMPVNGDIRAFQGLKALALRTALVYSAEKKKFLPDNNPYSNLEVDSAVVKGSASSVVNESITAIVNTLSEPAFEEEFIEEINAQIEFMSIEAVLLATQAYYMASKGEFVSKVDVGYMAEEEKLDVDVEFLNICSMKRQGADYAGGYTEGDDEEEITDSGKDSGVIHQIDDMAGSTFKYLSQLQKLIDKI